MRSSESISPLIYAPPCRLAFYVSTCAKEVVDRAFGVNVREHNWHGGFCSDVWFILAQFGDIPVPHWYLELFDLHIGREVRKMCIKGMLFCGIQFTGKVDRVLRVYILRCNGLGPQLGKH